MKYKFIKNYNGQDEHQKEIDECIASYRPLDATRAQRQYLLCCSLLPFIAGLRRQGVHLPEVIIILQIGGGKFSAETMLRYLEKARKVGDWQKAQGEELATHQHALERTEEKPKVSSPKMQALITKVAIGVKAWLG